LAQVLVQYSLYLQPGERLVLDTSPVAEELTLAVYKEAIQAGVHVYIHNAVPGAGEILYRYGSDAQLQFIHPPDSILTTQYDAHLTIRAPSNTRALSSIEPSRLKLKSEATRGLMAGIMDRWVKGEFKWCITDYPTQARAQEADMSISEYRNFVYSAGKLDKRNPVKEWKKESKRQQELVKWLEGKDEVVIRGKNIDLRLSIKGRTFVVADGKLNFPDGEIFTGPVEESANGWVRFAYPAIYGGREVRDIQLWFENGKVIREEAAQGQELLTEMLNSDEGARYLGELGIGTNYGIQRFTKNMLFDEKIGGTIHLAVGHGYPQTGSVNQSAVHWDMLCDASDVEIVVDGKLFYKDGKLVK
jgi:aminopeptidase